MLDKYRHESKQTLCIIGVLVLSAKLCKADGHFSEQEEEEILKIIPHEPQQKRILLKILDEAAKDPKPIVDDASRIKKLIGEEHSDFLEFILAVLVRLAKSDHVYSEEEERDIRKIAEVFNIKKTLYERMLIKIRLFFQSILTVFKKQNA
jgi:uncharacterized tellurite resistance protein B-like protein|tara:strand:- start:19 stop:468 length:450 start_codon:yes stop_codon:yes gene_type:complete